MNKIKEVNYILLINQDLGVKICQMELIRNDLESGQRDLSIDDIGFRVNDLKMQFRVRAKDFKSQILLGLRISNFAKKLFWQNLKSLTLI